MELCPHGKIEWCPKCDEDLRISAENQLAQCQKRLAEAEAIIQLSMISLARNSTNSVIIPGVNDCFPGDLLYCRAKDFLTHAPSDWVAVQREDLRYALSIIHVNIWGIKGEGGDKIDRLIAALEKKP